MTIEEIKDQLLSVYAIGTEWYDCVQDMVGIVVLHFRPRGIILKDTATIAAIWPPDAKIEEQLSRFTYTDMLSGRLIKPKTNGYFNEYREQLERENVEYNKLIGERKVWT